ncbi:MULTISPECIES: type II toxin-antitoxin system RelE/ParE family toxin [unclassified Burkholderia]|uniref:type II toxin-antitoxin system RelE/ParE family toxin n=1 Tax=unclassified Burkholderia TaxID=2613784 RepID=UPI001E2ABB01|nr:MULTISPECIES: type II toxin-antitoxin system RelE/ParE family toxin [unclassified Burkholderia]UEP29989.1 type II toxin-antitoxin system RelE/ParE family toxin [Burkholderia sp. B21-007]UEP44700.1 type II toxin-antitoxin system RelE/ParE family toxin [Burkholderia sp. B21-005]
MLSKFELLRYQRDDGREPFTEWLNAVRDKVIQARIRERLRRVQTGNFGDCEPVGEGVVELRIHVGASYRVYFGRYGSALILLLSGGDKRSQSDDIRRAHEHWLNWKRRQM